MLKLFSPILFITSLLIFSCSSDEGAEKMEEEEEEMTTAGDNEVVFADDNTTCEAHTSNPSISAQGILSVVMKPCQNSGSKLDGYFKYNSRPTAGTYNITGTVGAVPYSPNLAADEFSMVFYGHTSEALYSTAGTVTLVTNADDNAKLDLTWTDVTMEGSSGASIKFSGSFVGL